MKIKTKLILSISITIFFTCIIAGMSYNFLHMVQNRAEELVEFPIPSIIRLSKMSNAFLLSSQYALSYRVTGLPEEKERYFEQAEKFENLLMDLKVVLKYGTPEIPPEDVPLIDDLLGHWQSFKAQTNAYFLQKEFGTNENVDDILFEKNIRGIVETLDAYISLEQGEIGTIHNEINILTDRASLVIIIAAIVLLLIVISLNILVVRGIVMPLENFQTIVENFGKGIWHKRAEMNRKDEIGTLSTVFNSMANNIERSQAILEARVRERTSELNSKLEEIERLKHAAESGKGKGEAGA